MYNEIPRTLYSIGLSATTRITIIILSFTLFITAFEVKQTTYAQTLFKVSQEKTLLTQPPTNTQHSDHQIQNNQLSPTISTSTVITLADIERLAIQNNPTLAQTEAAIREAQGKRHQAGLWPNPVVGYQGEEFAFRAFSQKSEHFGFIEQTILLGGKLKKSQRIFTQEIKQAETEAAAQKQRVLNTVRILYYEVLGAQQRVELRQELVRIAREAVKTTAELLNIGQADQPDFLESEIEAQQVELELTNAENDLEQIWRLLASVVGITDMKPAQLAGDLESGLPKLDQEAAMKALLNESPQIKSARTEVERAQAVLTRARAERVPDLFLRGGFGYSTETLELRKGNKIDNRVTGPEASIQVGITLPIFNRNQGSIAAAQAELEITERDVKRLELSLRVQFAQAFRNYNNALSTVQRYQEVILPRAEKAYNQYLKSFQQMSAAYPQVLISQRTMFQVKEKYLNALVDLRQTTIQIEGFLLTGALDAPRFQSRKTERGQVEMTGVRSGSQGSSNQTENKER